MTLQSSSLMLIKIGDGEVSESFTTIGGLRNIEMEVANSNPENTNLTSGRWRSMASGMGHSQMAVSGEGLFTESTGEATLLAHALAGTSANYQLFLSNGDYLSGAFIISNYNRAGDIEGEETFLLTLISSGAVTYTSG